MQVAEKCKWRLRVKSNGLSHCQPLPICLELRT
jgi:hypothetical protein